MYIVRYHIYALPKTDICLVMLSHLTLPERRSIQDWMATKITLHMYAIFPQVVGKCFELSHLIVLNLGLKRGCTSIIVFSIYSFQNQTMCLVENRLSKTKTLFWKYVCDHIILNPVLRYQLWQNLRSYQAHMHMSPSQRPQMAMHVPCLWLRSMTWSFVPLLGALKVHPLGVAPELWVDFRSNPFKGLRLYAFEISTWLQGVMNLLGAPKVHLMGVAPELWVDFRSNPFKGLHPFAFEISIWFQGIVNLLGLWVDFRSNPFKGLHPFAFEISIWLQGIVNLLGALKVHPIGVAPELWVDFEIINSKVFIWCCFQNNFQNNQVTTSIHVLLGLESIWSVTSWTSGRLKHKILGWTTLSP
jgi:hypothetical protein